MDVYPVLCIRLQGAGDMSGVSEEVKGMDHPVGIAPVVPELGIVGSVKEVLRVVVEVADQLQELG